MLTRLKLAWLALTGQLRFAVIYDRPDGYEEYYEVFCSSAEAAQFFRDAYPKERQLTEPGTERLVLIVGPIDDYH